MFCTTSSICLRHQYFRVWACNLRSWFHLMRLLCSHFSWVLGEFLCKMYQFVHSLSYTASIFILVVICMERYFAIIHPITCKQILTSTRLRVSRNYFFHYNSLDNRQYRKTIAMAQGYGDVVQVLFRFMDNHLSCSFYCCACCSLH